MCRRCQGLRSRKQGFLRPGRRQFLNRKTRWWLPDRRGCPTSRGTPIETASDQYSLEDVMATGFAPTFLACGGIFLLSFFMIWAFWFVEQLRGASAPSWESKAKLHHK